MSVELRPVHLARRARDRRRSGLGLAASVVLHAALGAILVVFVASSDPGGHPGRPVPISVFQRHAGPAALAAQPAMPVAAGSNPPRRAPHVATIGQPVADAVLPAAGILTAGQVPATAADDSSGIMPATGAPGPAAARRGGGDRAGPAAGRTETAGAGVGGDGRGATMVPATTIPQEGLAERQYAMDVRRMLERRGAYPGTARRLGLEGVARMVIRIDPAGAVTDRRLLESSGFPQLDQAALESADRLGQLPPPPGGRPIEITVPVRFSMRRN